MTKPAANLPARLADIELVDPDGAPVRLGSTWSDRTVVLAHLRHFG